jgi:DNA-binding transcriptional LysR family regulator
MLFYSPRSICGVRPTIELLLPFDIRQLRFAIAAADHGSFYRAARALDVEQSTLSRSISRLERAVGTKLFHRSRAGVSTTFVGTSFIGSARVIVASTERMIATTRAAGKGQAGALVVGHNSSLSAGNLRATLLAWQEQNPAVFLEGIESDRHNLLGGISRRQIDIAILLGDGGHNGYRREAFWSERILVALPATHPLAAREMAHWTDLRGEHFILPASDPGPDIRDLLLGRLSQSGAPPDIKLSQTSRESVLSLLGAGSRLSIVCEGASGIRYPDVVYKQIYGEQGPALTSYSGYWRDDNANPPLKRFLSFIRDRYALSFDLALTRENKGSSSLEDFDHVKK